MTTLLLLLGIVAYGWYVYVQYKVAKENEALCSGKWYNITYLDAENKQNTQKMCILKQVKL